MALQIGTAPKAVPSWLVARISLKLYLGSSSKEGGFSFLPEPEDTFCCHSPSLCGPFLPSVPSRSPADEGNCWKDVAGLSCAWLKLHVALFVRCICYSSSSSLKRWRGVAAVESFWTSRGCAGVRVGGRVRFNLTFGSSSIKNVTVLNARCPDIPWRQTAFLA